MNAHDVLVRPVITEKSTRLTGLNKYVFEVHRDANKMEIKRAVEEVFKVNVTSVRTLWTQPKARRFGRHLGTTKPWKKAIVTLAAGQRIDLFPS
ncbi:MAG TPA: 50S ribosomal protein L23 [Myxococcales bacterium]|nr:50S ribosomal protein L23 [Myxococcales bacterium]